MEKTIELAGRFGLKHDTTVNWSNSSFVPMPGELVAYDYSQLKIGDGVTPIKDLPFYRPHTAEIADIWTFINGVPGGSGIYGLYVDLENRIFTRLGDAKGKTYGADFDSTFYGKIRRCNLSDSGAVNAYYGDSTFTEDGSNGQVMVEIPKFYYRVVADRLVQNELQTTMRAGAYYVSDNAALDFKIHPAFIGSNGEELEHIYIGAYECSTYDASTASYNLTDATFVSSEDKLSSIANAKPTSGLSTTFSRDIADQMAKNRGENWH